MPKKLVNNHSDFSWFVFLCIGIYLFCILPTASLWYDIFTMADAQRHYTYSCIGRIFICGACFNVCDTTSILSVVAEKFSSALFLKVWAV